MKFIRFTVSLRDVDITLEVPDHFDLANADHEEYLWENCEKWLPMDPEVEDLYWLREVDPPPIVPLMRDGVQVGERRAMVDGKIDDGDIPYPEGEEPVTYDPNQGGLFPAEGVGWVLGDVTR